MVVSDKSFKVNFFLRNDSSTLMSLSFTLATISLEVGSDVYHVAILVYILKAFVVVINFLGLHSSFGSINPQSFSQVRREDYLYGVDFR